VRMEKVNSVTNGMLLKRLLRDLSVHAFHGDDELQIKGLAYDSRAVKPGFLFVALNGHILDGHAFIEDAVARGAVAVVVESEEAGKNIEAKIPVVYVPNSREALAGLAVSFYHRPFDGLNLIAITGTNGKTTTSYLLESILLASGARPGVIGTINYRFPGHACPASVTTPESLDLMANLSKIKEAGCTDVIIEVSSHALDQGRTRICPFRVGIFTNISRDHLDYHGSMEEYFEAKSRLFRGLKQRGVGDLTRAVLNYDDPKGRVMSKLTDAEVVTYGLDESCEVRVDQIRMNRTGLCARLFTPIGEADIRSSLIGGFNIYNILAASAAALAIGIDLDIIAKGIADLRGVPGRLEMVENRRSLNIVVDYAHTPDALQKALEAVRPIVKGRLITVFGCGGDRDRGKRKEMGIVAGTYSDLVIITSDNPRSEDPYMIISQIEKGVIESGMKKVELPLTIEEKGFLIEPDRGRAIQKAVEMSDIKDLILIAGKGHEDYQIIGDHKRHFDDREKASEAAS